MVINWWCAHDVENNWLINCRLLYIQKALVILIISPPNFELTLSVPYCIRQDNGDSLIFLFMFDFTYTVYWSFKSRIKGIFIWSLLHMISLQRPWPLVSTLENID